MWLRGKYDDSVILSLPLYGSVYKSRPTFASAQTRTTKLFNTSYPNRRSLRSRAQACLSSGWALSWLGVLPCHWSAGRCVCRQSVNSSDTIALLGQHTYIIQDASGFGQSG
jgi:hypothetical protein